MDWSPACKLLAELILSCSEREAEIFEKRLHRYIHDLQPDVLITAYLESKLDDITEKEERRFKSDFYTAALLALEEEERSTVFNKCLNDLRVLYPKQVAALEQWLHDSPEGLTEHKKSRRAEKLNRYLKRIDGAIYARRYTLALKLANRCLKEYYQDFLNYKMPYESSSVENINQMSWSIYRYITKYFKKYNIPYPSSRLLFMTIVTNAIFMTMNNLMDENSYVDKAFATYARDNVNSIVRFLLKYF